MPVAEVVQRLVDIPECFQDEFMARFDQMRDLHLAGGDSADWHREMAGTLRGLEETAAEISARLPKGSFPARMVVIAHQFFAMRAGWYAAQAEEIDPGGDIGE